MRNFRTALLAVLAAGALLASCQAFSGAEDARLEGDAAPPSATDVADAADAALEDDVDASPAKSSCFDGVQNGSETGVDCGGSACVPCGWVDLRTVDYRKLGIEATGPSIVVDEGGFKGIGFGGTRHATHGMEITVTGVADDHRRLKLMAFARASSEEHSFDIVWRRAPLVVNPFWLGVIDAKQNVNVRSGGVHALLTGVYNPDKTIDSVWGNPGNYSRPFDEPKIEMVADALYRVRIENHGKAGARTLAGPCDNTVRFDFGPSVTPSSMVSKRPSSEWEKSTFGFIIPGDKDGVQNFSIIAVGVDVVSNK